MSSQTQPTKLPSLCKTMLLSLVLAASLGCANNPQRHPEDPWEPFNRQMFAFNEGLDKAVAKPAATAYQSVTPYPVRLHITNFFNNLQDGWTMVNNALQLRPEAFLQSAFRFGFNTLWGMGGFVNIADDMGFTRDPQDFGKTLGRWGVSPGPYIVLPVLGPSTLRDSAGLAVDVHYDLINHEVEHIPSRNSLYALELVDKRANLLAAGSILDGASLDKYAFSRNAYMQKRRSDIDALRMKKEADADYYDAQDDWKADASTAEPAASPEAQAAAVAASASASASPASAAQP